MTKSAVAPSRGAVVALPAQIRTAFPALERMHLGQPVAYFDGPGGTQVPRAVVAAMEDYLFHHNANTHWRYPTSEETDALIAGARSALADFLGATPAEIAFGANMTTLTFHLARALGRQWGPGDTVVITELDHHANVAPWRALERERGVTIRSVPLVPETGQLDWPKLEELLSGSPRLLAIGAASNALGTISDVTRAAALARTAGALAFVDAVHFAPHEPVDVAQIGCDFLACSAYKFFGPHVGVLYGRGDLLAQHRPYKVRPAPDEPPHSWETGTINLEGIAGTAAAIRYLRDLGMDRVVAYERELSARLLEGLESIAGVTVYGTRDLDRRCPTYAFNVAGKHPSAVSAALGEQNVFVWDGNYYALELMQRLGIDDSGGAVRVGAVHYNTAEEIDSFLEAVSGLA
jgi:cysteine desulfurase family protein (TIGR01976 family)